MNLADKIAKANMLAAYLGGTTIDLRDELVSRGLGDLSGDPEFDRIFAQRVHRCSACEAWIVMDPNLLGEPAELCDDCVDDWEDWDYE